MNKNVIATIVIGEKFKQLADIVIPRFKNYAECCNADLVVFDSYEPYPNIFYKKLDCFNLYEKYDRVLYLDLDVFIRKECPNIFDLVPESDIGVISDEISINHLKRGYIRELQTVRLNKGLKLINTKIFDDKTYFNAGVMLVPSCSKEFFSKPTFYYTGSYHDQCHFNYRLVEKGYSSTYLNKDFNYFIKLHTLPGTRDIKNFYHAAGCSVEDTITIFEELIRRRL